MNYEQTERVWTLALSTKDATILRGGNQIVTCQWPVYWSTVFPPDVAPGSTFIVTHSFVETYGQRTPVDKLMHNIRSRNLICNLPAYSYVSNVRSTDGISPDLWNYGVQGTSTTGHALAGNTPALVAPTNNNLPGTMQAGFLNRMYKQTFNASTKTATNRYSWLNVYGGQYRCDERTFECIAPEQRNFVAISFIDDVAVPTLANYNSTFTVNSSSLLNQMWGTAAGGTGGGSLVSDMSANGTVNGYLPSFYTMGDAAAANDNPHTETCIDLGPPQGTHVFTFRLVQKIPFNKNQY